MPDTILRLALPSPLRRLFDYLAPQGVPHAALQPGVRLRVPFGRREVVGVLVEVAQHSEVPADKLKPALQLLDRTPPLPAPLPERDEWEVAVDGALDGGMGRIYRKWKMGRAHRPQAERAEAMRPG